MSEAPATYVYCLLQAAGAPTLEGAPPGLPGCGPVRVLEAWSSLWLIVADAPAEEYGADAIGRGLADLEWVSRQALAHEALVEHALSLGTVVPMKLFTQFLGDGRALEDIRGRRAELEAILAAIAGHQEWSVRLRVDAAAAQRARREAAARQGPAASGTDFLRRKQQEREAARSLDQDARASGEALLEELRALAADSRLREPLNPEGAGTRLVLDAALLVPEERADELRAAVDRRAAELAPAGLDVSLSGPWPAYHFVGGES